MRKILFLMICLSAATTTLRAQSHYLFAYFTNNGEDGLHLAYSRDGLQWRALNEDKPFLTPQVEPQPGGQPLMRDPCLVQGPDGTFHLVWTTGWEGRNIGIAHSKDLIEWSEQQAIPVMADEPTALNCWAPEIFYDADAQQYLIYWATTIPGKFPETANSASKGRNHRIYYVTTKDFVSYSKTQLFYDGGFNVIDATIVPTGRTGAARFALIVKDETELPEAKKHLRIATSAQATGPWSAAGAPFTRDWVEGPAALKVGAEWLVYYDEYRDHKYGARKTRDWQTWEDVSASLSFPKGMRHGTAFPVSEAMINRLMLTWNQAQRQKPEWYASADARRVADNLIVYQGANGGWPKNTNMAIVLSLAERLKLVRQREQVETTIDNGATHSQLVYLAKVFQATQLPRYERAFLRGLDYLFAAQYENGGWPQFYPLKKGYYSHITYNDNALVGVLNLLRDVAQSAPAYAFVDVERRQRAARAIEKGTEIILKTQIVVNGKKTVWCAQHDEVTLAPAPARSYEHISLSGSESVGLVRFLMGIETPDARVIEAIESAIGWFRAAQLNGIRVIETRYPTVPSGVDRVVVNDAKAPPLWARFYDIKTNRPIFSGRDGVIKATLAEIEHERRTGYSWYSDAPRSLLEKDYPQWRARLGRK